LNRPHQKEVVNYGVAGITGGELILLGIKDLHNGNSETVGALLIAIASTRLTEAGLNFPTNYLISEPELTLYDRLQNKLDDAYPYYNAVLSSLNSFCNALELAKET
jgi:hypothetical protein